MQHPERVSRDEAVALVRGYARASAYPRASELMRGNLIEKIEGIKPPITLAWAEFDTLVRRTPIRAFEGIAHQVELLGCGHIPTWDDPDLVSQVVLEGSSAARSVTPGAAPAQ